MPSTSLLIISHIQSTAWCVHWPIWIGNVICVGSVWCATGRLCLSVAGAEGFDFNLSTQMLPLHCLMLEIPQMWAAQSHTPGVWKNILINSLFTQTWTFKDSFTGFCIATTWLKQNTRNSGCFSFLWGGTLNSLFQRDEVCIFNYFTKCPSSPESLKPDLLYVWVH